MSVPRRREASYTPRMRRGLDHSRRLLTTPGIRETGVIAGILVVGLLVRLPNLNAPLLAISSFRQTETAYPALIYHQQGINLLFPQLPVLGKPWQVPFEFPLFQAMAALLMNLGGAVDWAMRMSSVICCMATAVALWGLVRHISTRTAAALAVLAFLASPFTVWWSRASMIEYMATAFSVGYVWAGMIWIDRRQRRFAVLAIALGTLAMLVKVTSAVFWMVPLFLYWGTVSRPPLREWLRERLRTSAVLFAIPLAACVLWTHHADAIKAASPATSWMTSEALIGFNFGWVSQRLDPHQWSRIIHPFDTFVTGLPFWVFAAVCVIAILRERHAVWIGITLAGALPVLTFMNLYAVQAYYLAAVTPAAAAVIGYALDGIIRYWRSVPLRAAAMLVVIAWLGATLYVQREFLASSYTTSTPDPSNVLTQAREIDAGTQPQDLIVFDGLSWSPAVPYYARRRGMMLLQIIDTPQVLNSLPRQGYTYLYTLTPSPGSFSAAALAVLQRWAWFGDISAHLFRLGPTYASVDKAYAAATAQTFQLSGGASALMAGSRRMLCNGSTTDVTVPSGLTVTLQFAAPSPAEGMSLAVNGRWLPAERTVVVNADASSSGSLRLTCAGGIELDLDGAYAQRP
jgi:4-amino-4-deoxy-L-arabinose transferase-like glycosyltransferase